MLIALLLTKQNYRYHLAEPNVLRAAAGMPTKRDLLTNLFGKVRSLLVGGTMAHLGIGIVADELSRSGFNVEIREMYDDQVIADADDFDLVGISCLDISFPRTVELLERLDPSKTLVGGIGATVLEDRLREQFPEISLLKGESEGLMQQVAADIKNGGLKPLYQRPDPVDLSDPSEVLVGYRSHPYFTDTFFQVLEVGRGCTQKCPYCITPLHNPRVTYKPLGIIEKELDQIAPSRPAFIIDQNLLAYPEEYLLEFLKLLNKRRQFWLGEGTIDAVIDNDKILEALSKTCLGFLIGVEDMTGNRLEGAGLKNSLNSGFAEKARKLRRYRIPTTYSIMFGTDDQTYPDVFVETAEIVNRLGLTVVPHIATPRVGTDWYDQVVQEGRLIDDDLAHTNQKLHCIHKPAQMSRDELLGGFAWFYQRVFSPFRVAERVFMSLNDCGPKYFAGTLALESDAYISKAVLRERFGHLINQSDFPN